MAGITASLVGMIETVGLSVAIPGLGDTAIGFLTLEHMLLVTALSRARMTTVLLVGSISAVIFPITFPVLEDADLVGTLKVGFATLLGLAMLLVVTRDTILLSITMPGNRDTELVLSVELVASVLVLVTVDITTTQLVASVITVELPVTAPFLWDTGVVIGFETTMRVEKTTFELPFGTFL